MHIQSNPCTHERRFRQEVCRAQHTQIEEKGMCRVYYKLRSKGYAERVTHKQRSKRCAEQITHKLRSKRCTPGAQSGASNTQYVLGTDRDAHQVLARTVALQRRGGRSHVAFGAAALPAALAAAAAAAAAAVWRTRQRMHPVKCCCLCCSRESVCVCVKQGVGAAKCVFIKKTWCKILLSPAISI